MYTAAPGKKDGVTSFPGHNLDCRTQSGHRGRRMRQGHKEGENTQYVCL